MGWIWAEVEDEGGATDDLNVTYMHHGEWQGGMCRKMQREPVRTWTMRCWGFEGPTLERYRILAA